MGFGTVIPIGGITTSPPMETTPYFPPPRQGPPVLKMFSRTSDENIGESIQGETFLPYIIILSIVVIAIVAIVALSRR